MGGDFDDLGDALMAALPERVRDGVLAVVLLHGLGATSTLMLPMLATLAPHHRALTPDLSGFGSSAAPSWDYDPAQLQHWLRAFLDTGGAPTAAAIGHSLGGRVALELALRPPDTARSLVLLCPAPAAGRQRPRTTLPRRLPADLTRLPIAFPHRLLHEGTRGANHTLTADPGQVPRHWFDAAADEWEIALRDPNTGGPSGRPPSPLSRRTVRRHGGLGRLPQLAVPTLCVWGAGATVVPAPPCPPAHRHRPAGAVRNPAGLRTPAAVQWPRATGALIDDFLPGTACHPPHRRDRLTRCRHTWHAAPPVPEFAGENMLYLRHIFLTSVVVRREN